MGRNEGKPASFFFFALTIWLNHPVDGEQTRMSSEPDTEAKIFEAARTVFHTQGFEGARMQEIADRAGINKAMLHYYYRSKDKLFEAVFRDAAAHVLPRVIGILREDVPLRDKLERLVHAYIDLISANPHLPAFIIQELRRNPEGLSRYVGEQTEGLYPRLAQQIEGAVARGEIRPIAPAHLLANVVALCVFPFIARPMLQAVTGLDDAAYAAFLEARKQEVITFLFAALAP
jgi:TetR/AcrR family transcriptional regulator